MKTASGVFLCVHYFSIVNKISKTIKIQLQKKWITHVSSIELLLAY